MAQVHPGSEQASLNTSTQARDLIDQAADCQGRSRSDLILDVSCQDPEDVFLSQTFFTVDTDTFAKFEALLNNPLPPTDKLRRLLQTKAPWES